MKKQTITKITAMFALFIALGSCSKDDNSTQKPNPDPTNPTNPDDPNNPNPEKTYYYKQKVLLEDYTSIGCVACPVGSFTIEEIAKTEYNSQIISVGIHDNFRDTKDPYRLSSVNTYIAKLFEGKQFVELPSLFWNRDQTRWKSNELLNGEDTPSGPRYFLDNDLFKDYIKKQNLLSTNSNIGIKITSTLENTTGKVTFSLKFAQDLNQELKYLIYILEDNLKYQQANATPLYGNTTGTPRWEMDFIHNHVVRGTNNFLGDAIDTKESVKDKEFTHSVDLNYTLDNIANASVVVAILDKNGKVLNAQIAKANTTQDYEIVK